MKVFTLSPAGGSQVDDILVFAVAGCVQSPYNDPGYQNYHQYPMTYSIQPADVGCKDYGTVDTSMGLFTAKRPGMYRFHFSGVILNEETCKIQLSVNSSNGASKFLSHDYVVTAFGVNSKASLMAVVPMQIGDSVGVYMEKGQLIQSPANHFSGYFVSAIDNPLFA